MSTNPYPERAAKHRAGERVGRFELLDVLGPRRSGRVWRANDQRLDREVALKLLSPDAQSVSVHQWLHEARAVSRLSHPNIVPVFEADEVEGQSYLVFELVRGQTLGRGAAAQRRDARARCGGVVARRAGGAARGTRRKASCTAISSRSNILLGPDGRAAGDGLRHRGARQRRRGPRLRHAGLHVA